MAGVRLTPGFVRSLLSARPENPALRRPAEVSTEFLHHVLGLDFAPDVSDDTRRQPLSLALGKNPLRRVGSRRR
jgi:hypothetical protein